MSGALNSHIIELVVIFQICTSNCWGLRQIAEISLNFTPICVKSGAGRLEGECETSQQHQPRTQLHNLNIKLGHYIYDFALL